MFWDFKMIGLKKFALSTIAHPEKCFVESTKISIDPYLNEKLC